MEEQRIDRRTKRSKEAIRNAFMDLLREKDLSQITVTEITRRADRNRKTFYLHYNSIDDLIDEILQEECEDTVKIIDHALGSSSTGIDIPKLYEAMGTSLFSKFNRNSTVLRHVDTQSLIALVRPRLARAIAEKDSLGLANTLGPYLEIFVSYFTSGILSLYSQWLTLESELPLETLSELAMATVAGGVSALVKAAEEAEIDEPCKPRP